MISPEGLQTVYLYDKRGLLSQKTTPDLGTTDYEYDDNGAVRFMQDANPAAANRYMAYSYDFAGRVIKEETCSGGIPSSLTASFSSSQQAIVYTYDEANSAPSGVTFTINNALSNLTIVDFQGGYYLYSYDTEGNIERMYNKLDGLNGRTITYDYNRLGELTGVEMDGNPHVWEYTYDALGRLDLVKTNTTSTTAVDADYGYWPAGMVQTEELGNQTINYGYDARDRLSSINDVASSSHPFSATYTYLANGNINVAQYHQPTSPHSDKRYRFTHSYDNRNQLTQADYTYWNGAGWSTSTEFDLSSVSYNMDGNITAKTHNNASQSGSHTYSYTGSTNKVSSITSNISRGGSTSLSFGYDANGNVTSLSGLGYSIGSVSYDWRNLPLSLNAGGSRTYRYDHAGARVYKSYEGVHYLRGAYGEILAVYEGGSLAYWNILSPDGTPIGRRESGGTLRYYHRDHLGSTRAVVTAGGTVTEAYDFMPFGMEMDRSKTSSGPTRNKFTRHETDEETQLIHMEWRGYLAEFGRFLGVDPMAHKFHGWSPYVYAANNPLIFIDPDGRDYKLHFDEENNTVTVQANYYATANSIEGAQNAADFWNSQSGEFTYTVGKGDNAQSYTVNFEINVIEVAIDSNIGEIGSLNLAMAGDKAGNVFRVVADDQLSTNQAGSTQGGNYIRVAESYSLTSTGAHEIGHTLGLTHSNRGLMTPTRSSPARGNFVTSGNMRDMIRNPLVGKVNMIGDAAAGIGIITTTGNVNLQLLKRGRIR